jgi:hypothetical protein
VRSALYFSEATDLLRFVASLTTFSSTDGVLTDTSNPDEGNQLLPIMMYFQGDLFFKRSMFFSAFWPKIVELSRLVAQPGKVLSFEGCNMFNRRQPMKLTLRNLTM